MKSFLWLVASALVCALTATTVSAQTSDDERARAHFQAGQSYFAQGRYAESAEQFDEAYRLSGRAALLSNASVAFERAGNLELAIARLETYLESGAPEVEATRVTLTTRLESLRTQLAEREAAERAEQARLSEQTEHTDPTEDDSESVPRDASPPDSRKGMRVAGLAIGGAGVGLGITSIVLGARARAIHDDLREVCGPNGDACPPDRADDIDRGSLFSGLAIGTMAGSLATLAAGTTLFLLGRRDDDEPSTSAFIDIAPDRVAVTAFGRF